MTCLSLLLHSMTDSFLSLHKAHSIYRKRFYWYIRNQHSKCQTLKLASRRVASFLVATEMREGRQIFTQAKFYCMSSPRMMAVTFDQFSTNILIRSRGCQVCLRAEMIPEIFRYLTPPKGCR